MTKPSTPSSHSYTTPSAHSLPSLLQLENLLQMISSDKALRTSPDVIEFLQPNGGGQPQGVIFMFVWLLSQGETLLFWGETLLFWGDVC